MPKVFCESEGTQQTPANNDTALIGPIERSPGIGPDRRPAPQRSGGPSWHAIWTSPGRSIDQSERVIICKAKPTEAKRRSGEAKLPGAKESFLAYVRPQSAAEGRLVTIFKIKNL
ncbi:hypothetical protein V8F20_002009 [Naviculisporaceae sp. PSN 640]